MIFCDPAVTITTNLLLIFVRVPHQLKTNIMQLDLKSTLSKNVKKLKTHVGFIYSSSKKCVHFYIRFRTVCSYKTDYIILTIQCIYFYIRFHTIYSCKTCKTRGVSVGHALHVLHEYIV